MIKTTFYKVYSAEELCDLERDIIESFDPNFNEIMKEIPEDEYGFSQGEFKVIVIWDDGDDATLAPNP